jgi:pimeloyl-ACP methyl ester carboxylesterase
VSVNPEAEAAMKIEVQTSLGPVWFFGQSTGRPILLIITGAYAGETLLDHTHTAFPGHDVLRAHLPGNHCPQLVATSIGAYAAAYTEALEAVALGRPVAVVGLSTGALVAMALRNRCVRALVAVEPPLLTEHLWPLDERLQRSTPEDAEFVWAVFGIGRGPIVGRNYASVLESLSVPTTVLIGDIPLLPRRPLETIPSLVDDQARALLGRNPHVRIVVVPNAGHNIPRQGTLVMLKAMQDACAQAARA